MSLILEKQLDFTRDLALLIQFAASLGYRAKIGEVLRSDEQAEINAIGFDGRKAVSSLLERAYPLLAKKIGNNQGNGIRNSVHMLQLAADLQLFDGSGNWLQEARPYELLADHWESLAPDYRAGVRWGDTPHFSVEWQGAK